MDYNPEHQHRWLQLTFPIPVYLVHPVGICRVRGQEVPSWLNCFAPDNQVRAKP